MLIVAIRRASGQMVPTPSAGEVLAAGDVLIAIGAPAKVRALGQRMEVRPRSAHRG